jgi:hypothetical protein
MLEVLMAQFRFFGLFFAKIEEIASLETVQTILYLIHKILKKETTPFAVVSEREICNEDKDFIQKMMKLDCRDRPTATELLQDEWWGEDED